MHAQKAEFGGAQSTAALESVEMRRIRAGDLADFLLRPTRISVSLVIALIAGLTVWVMLLPRTAADGSAWRVDEAHKVSETYALRLLLEGRWSDAAWFREPVDRTNPQFGKYAFGAAVLLAGERLPDAPSLSRLAGAGSVMSPYVAERDAIPYRPLLRPSRRASLCFTALTAAIIAWLATRLHGPLAALLGVAFFAMHWMTIQFGTTAIFDPLLMLLVVSVVPPLIVIVGRPALSIALAPLIGLLCASAFQTRLSGGVALVASLAVYLMVCVHTRTRQPVIGAAVLVSTFAITSVAMNPYYWATAPEAAGVPIEFRQDGSLVPRVLSRLERQVGDLDQILSNLTVDGIRLPLWAAESNARVPVAWTLPTKLRFVRKAIAEDAAGIAMLVAAIVGFVILCIRGPNRRELVAMAAWSLLTIGITLAWLPLPWARYLMVMLPPVTILAGVGCASLFQLRVPVVTLDRT